MLACARKRSIFYPAAVIQESGAEDRFTTSLIIQDTGSSCNPTFLYISPGLVAESDAIYNFEHLL